MILSYIDAPYPVGSQTVTRNFSFGLSPATIRNIMGELEELGFLAQPHPSAGRVPTPKGYRLYVDDLMGEGQSFLYQEDLLDEQHLAAKREDIHALLQETTRMLSILSNYAGVVVGPNMAKALLDRLEFILLRRGHVLVIEVSSDGMVQHRMIQADPELTQPDLIRISRFLNEKFGGRTLDEIQLQLLKEMKAEKDMYDRLLRQAIELAQKALGSQPEEELYLEGTSNILNLPDFEDIERMKGLFQAFEEKAAILSLLNNLQNRDGVQTLIGSEIDHPAIRDCSLVLSTYKSGPHTLGTLGVIGPTRMDYARIIPLVDHTARLLSRLIERI